MKIERPTDREIWDAIDTLSRAVGYIARDRVDKNQQGQPADDLRAAELARAASMDMSCTISDLLNRYKS